VNLLESFAPLPRGPRMGELLREAGKRSQPELVGFLREHDTRVPRTTLRYAIERLDALDRKAWLAGPQG